MLIVECVIRECIRIQIHFIFRDPRSMRLVKNNCSNLTSSCLFKKNTILLSVLFLSLLLFKNYVRCFEQIKKSMQTLFNNRIL